MPKPASTIHTIDEYKTRLGYGARATLWEILFDFPVIITNGEVVQDVQVLTTQVKFPSPRVVKEIRIPYRGDFIGIAGDKEDYENGGKCEIKISGAENMKVRNLIELWMQVIQQDVTNLRSNPSTYKVDTISISRLDHNRQRMRTAKLVGAWPVSLVSDGDQLLSEPNSKVDEITVSLSYDRYELLPVS